MYIWSKDIMEAMLSVQVHLYRWIIIGFALDMDNSTNYEVYNKMVK